MYTSVNKYNFVFHFSNMFMHRIWKQGLEKKEVGAQNICDIFSLQSKRAKDTLLIGEPQMLPLFLIHHIHHGKAVPLIESRITFAKCYR